MNEVAEIVGQAGEGADFGSHDVSIVSCGSSPLLADMALTLIGGNAIFGAPHAIWAC
jgi:hypothetical protein